MSNSPNIEKSNYLLLHGAAPTVKNGKITGRAIHPMVGFSDQFPQIREFLAEKLEKAVGLSFFPLPIVEDHGKIFDAETNHISKMAWDSEKMEISYEGDVDDALAQAIEAGVYKNGVSIEIDFPPGSKIDFVEDGKAIPDGFRYVGLSLLKEMVPFDKTTTLEVWNNAVSAMEKLVHAWEETDANIRSGHGDKSSFDQDSFRTIDIDADKGIQAVIGCPSGSYEGGKCKVGTEVQSFLFDKAKGWDLEKAKAWFKARDEGNKARQAGSESSQERNNQGDKTMSEKIGKPECETAGGTWDETTQTCKMPEKPENEGAKIEQQGSKDKATCEANGGAWDEATMKCTMPDKVAQATADSAELVALRKEKFANEDRAKVAEGKVKEAEEKLETLRQGMVEILPSKMAVRSWTWGPQTFVKQVRTQLGLAPEE